MERCDERRRIQTAGESTGQLLEQQLQCASEKTRSGADAAQRCDERARGETREDGAEWIWVMESDGEADEHAPDNEY